MFFDLKDFPEATHVDADVCIVGAGAAGITLARELIGSSLTVCLLESGGFDFDAATQALNRGDITGYPYYGLDTIRLRYFGGTTNHWGGGCRPLDDIDFEKRADIPNSGWPFGKQDLDPFYARAHTVCKLGAYDYDPSIWESPLIRRLRFDAARVDTAMMRARATRFGQEYRADLEQAANVRVYLSATVTRIEAVPDGGIIREVRAQSLNGRQLTAAAKVFVLATGAIENARLLLVSNDVHKEGLGNDNDLVGRYFMEHLNVAHAVYLPAGPDTYPSQLYDSVMSPDGTYALGFLVPTTSVLRAEGMLNIRSFVALGSAEEESAKSLAAVQSAGFVWNDLQQGKVPDNLSDHIWNIVRDLDDVFIYSYRRSFEPLARQWTLVSHIAQAPNPDSRVTLSDERDDLGMNRVRLAWKFGDIERLTLRRFSEILAREVGRLGLGRLRILENEEGSDWPAGVRGAWHQMGTTRMSSDPTMGVVDENCRVHGIANLYVAGSSVFPTSGYTNPTLTLVALAIRLADHLKER